MNRADIIAAYLLQHKETPFSWGKHDCCLFAADIVQAITGIDYAADFRGRYTTEVGAARALKRYGQGTISATFDNLLGERSAILNARRGDVMLVIIDGKEHIGIMFGQVFLLSTEGLVQFPITAALSCWRID